MTLLTRLGADTVAIEQYTRTASRIEGTVIARSPSTTISRYAVDLGPNDVPTHATFSITRGDGTPIPNVYPLEVHYRADSIVFTNHRPAGDTTRASPARGSLVPYANNSFALYELGIARLRGAGRDSGDITIVPMNFGARTFSVFPVRLFAGDSARITWFGFPLLARYDRNTSLLGVDASRTTVKTRTDRVSGTDLVAMAKQWAAHDQAAGAMGQVSTRDTVKATLGGAHLWIDYGRPALRGRDVWVNGVLGDTLWRAGANAATQFRTDAEVSIGGAAVPAGLYTLWIATNASGQHHLVINKQAGQWGTDYHADRDLVRVRMTESALAEPVERYTIVARPRGSAGTISFQWGRKELSVPVSAK